MAKLESVLRLTAGLLFLAVVVPLWMLLLVPLLPWRWVRARLCNHLGTVMGAGIMRISGCPLTILGREHVSAERPAIYVGNHTSVYDAFLSVWLSPTGTVGVAKKEIVFYPFFGQAWMLSGHLTIDRSNPETARRSLNELGDVVRDEKLHVFMWPEGKRARDGRLLPFKKGFAHLALRTRLPIVPMVVEGAHRAWPKRSLVLERVPIRVTFLPPIDTTRWEEANLDAHIAEVHRVFERALPPEQLPEPAAGARG